MYVFILFLHFAVSHCPTERQHHILWTHSPFLFLSQYRAVATSCHWIKHTQNLRRTAAFRVLRPHSTTRGPTTPLWQPHILQSVAAVYTQLSYSCHHLHCSATLTARTSHFLLTVANDFSILLEFQYIFFLLRGGSIQNMWNEFLCRFWHGIITKLLHSAQINIVKLALICKQQYGTGHTVHDSWGSVSFMSVVFCMLCA